MRIENLQNENRKYAKSIGNFHVLEYVGEGCLVLEPTYKYIILADVGKWGSAGITIEDGMFLACDANVKSKVVARRNLSSVVLGDESLFNLNLQGNGVAALESNVPEDELIEK